ncbi:MAG: cupredoxin domain-containing protein [Coriobacteriia bacterium]
MGTRLAAALLVAGALLAPALAPQPAAALVTSGVQSFRIRIGWFGYEPSKIVAAAGRPIVLYVGRGFGCAGGFIMPRLRVERNNTRGAITVRLGSLRPGRYIYSCGMGMITGTLVVR